MNRWDDGRYPPAGWYQKTCLCPGPNTMVGNCPVHSSQASVPTGIPKWCRLCNSYADDGCFHEQTRKVYDRIGELIARLDAAEAEPEESSAPSGRDGAPTPTPQVDGGASASFSGSALLEENHVLAGEVELLNRRLEEIREMWSELKDVDAFKHGDDIWQTYNAMEALLQ